MLSSYKVFTNYLGHPVHLVLDTWHHMIIQRTIENPDTVLISEANVNCELYFLQKNEVENNVRFSVVVIKIKQDGLWISTAMTKKKVSGGIEIYRREKC